MPPYTKICIAKKNLVTQNNVIRVYRDKDNGLHVFSFEVIREMLDFCGEHGITADVEVIPIQKVNEAYERMLKSDVKYRFSIDMGSLREG